jgi:eukaryotic-like serine/threonine-protein kinase
MDPERWSRVRRIFDEVYDLPAPERGPFLDAACTDPGVRHEIESLLAEESDVHRLVDNTALDATGLIDALTRVGQQVGPYRLVRQLGTGGMGEVYLAERADGEFEQQVALKLVRSGLASAHLLARFRSERQILARLQHPNIARLLDGGLTDAGQPYLVMEYVDGRPIDEYADARSLSVDARLDLFAQVCGAVAHAHARLVIHRDLKPSNILVTDDGRVTLLDFGIAKMLTEDGDETLTRTGARVMSPAYASPEQVRGGPVSTATDIYSLGVVLYELIAGCRPYAIDPRDPAEIARVVSEVEPTRPSTAITAPRDDGRTTETISRARSTDPARLRRRLAGDLDIICLKALRKEPDRRYRTADELGEDVRRHRAGEPIHARADSMTYRAGRLARRHRWGVGTAAGVVLLVAILVVFYTQRLRHERDRAEIEARKAREVATFLRGIFEVADPSVSKGETVTARALLDEGARRIDARLAGEPEVQSAMMGVIGNVYLSLGLPNDAARMDERALALRRATAGPRDSTVATSLTALAAARQQQGAFVAAESLYREGLALRTATFPPGHPDVLASLAGVASVRHARGDDVEAESLYTIVLAGQRARSDATPAELAQALYDIGTVQHMDGRFDAAGKNFREAIATLRAAPVPDALAIADITSDLAVLLKNKGEFAAAEPLYREVLALRRRYFGEVHSLVAQSMGNLAILLNLEDRRAEAESLSVRSLEIYRQTVGEDHPQFAYGLNSVAMARLRRNDCAGAVPLFRQAVDVQVRALGDSLWVPNAIRLNLGRCLTRLGKYPEAEQVLLTARSRLVAALGDTASLAARARENLVALYTAWGRPSQAAQYR